MLESIFKEGIDIKNIIIMSVLALIIGLIYSFIASLKIRSSKGFFITLTLIPLIVSLGISVLCDYLLNTSENVSRVATIAIALGLIRFRSNNGSAVEMLLLLSSVISGLLFGLGYVFYASCFSIVFIIIFFILESINIFDNKKFKSERLLKITIPESINYTDIFKDEFELYLKEYEIVEVKTCDLGSMFKISYRVILKDINKEKELIDNLRIKNANLEINIMPYLIKNNGL